MKNYALGVAIALSASSSLSAAGLICTVKGDENFNYGYDLVSQTWRTTWYGLHTVLFDGGGPWGDKSYIRMGDFRGNGYVSVVSPDRARMLFYEPSTRYTRLYQPAQGIIVANSWGSAAYTRVGDFNGDGSDDIASASGSSVYMKLGGTLSETWSCNGSWGASGYTFVGDFNGDGRDDFASASGGNVYMKLSNPAAKRFDHEVWPVANIWGNAGYTFVGDFNGDGRADIASAVGTRVYMRLSVAVWGFMAQTWTNNGQWGPAAYTWALDINGDGKTDLVSAKGSTLEVKRANPSGNGFVTAPAAVLNQWGKPGYNWVIDYDEDGRPDIVSGNGGTMYVKRNNGDSTFSSFSYPLSNAGWGAPEFTFAVD